MSHPPNRTNEPVLEHKAFESFEIKNADKGEVEACIATLGVVDRDGDIIDPGAIGDGTKVAVSSYGHDAVFGAMPVGKGTLSVVGNKAMFKGRLFMDTTGGRETFSVLKEMGSDQEWSFGFQVLGEEVPSEAQKKQGAYRILKKLGAFEVSPVIMGAGIGTGTTSVKASAQADGDAVSAPAAGGDAAAAPIEPAKSADEIAAETKAAQRMAEQASQDAARALAAQTAIDEEVARFHRNLRRYS